jgi:hypothetical protein
MRKLRTIQELYHGTTLQLELPSGTILTPKEYTARSPHLNGVETILEKYRPIYSIPRYNSVYMVDDPARVIEAMPARGGNPVIYQVEPIGLVERNDLGWYDYELRPLWDECRRTGNDEYEMKAKELAFLYWAGDEYYNLEDSLFEYRAVSARIIKRIQ